MASQDPRVSLYVLIAVTTHMQARWLAVRSYQSLVAPYRTHQDILRVHVLNMIPIWDFIKIGRAVRKNFLKLGALKFSQNLKP